VALAHGAYTGDYARGSHDGDTHFRISEHEDRMVHVPEILYSWRMAPTSTSGSIAAKDYIRDSQMAVLEQSLARRGLLDRFEVRHDSRREGVGFWVCERKMTRPARIDVLLHLHGAPGARSGRGGARGLAAADRLPVGPAPRPRPRSGRQRPSQRLPARGRPGRAHCRETARVAASDAEIVVVVDVDVRPHGNAPWVWGPARASSSSIRRSSRRAASWSTQRTGPTRSPASAGSTAIWRCRSAATLHQV
jgi:hypothetical protein